MAIYNPFTNTFTDGIGNGGGGTTGPGGLPIGTGGGTTGGGGASSGGSNGGISSGGFSSGLGSTTNPIFASFTFPNAFEAWKTLDSFKQWFVQFIAFPAYYTQSPDINGGSGAMYPTNVQSFLDGMTFTSNGTTIENWLFFRQGPPSSFTPDSNANALFSLPISQRYGMDQSGYFTDSSGNQNLLFKNDVRFLVGENTPLWNRMIAYEAWLRNYYATGGDGGGDDSDGGDVPVTTSKVFKQFGGNEIIKNSIVTVTKGLWANNSGSINTYQTSSKQDSISKTYYYSIQNLSSEECDVFDMFDVTYGHYNGLGSYSGDATTHDSPAKAIYGQYRLKCLDENTNKFTFNGTETDYIYVINFNRKRMKDRLDSGNFQFTLAELSGSSNLSMNTGSNVTVATGSNVVTLIDDSSDVSVARMDNVFNIVSGSINDGIYSSDTVYGSVYLDLGVIILDGRKLDSDLNFGTVTGSNQNGDNSYKLYTSISGSGTTTSERSTKFPFIARSSERKTRTHYYVNALSNEFNFSDNPTFASSVDGEFTHKVFIKNPKTYVHSIGLYNNRNELLAVAKTNKAIQKNFQEELKFQINLEY